MNVQTPTGTESPLLPDLIIKVDLWTLQVPSCPESRISCRMNWGDVYWDKSNSLTDILTASVPPKKMCQEALLCATWHLSHAAPHLAFLTWAKETSTSCQWKETISLCSIRIVSSCSNPMACWDVSLWHRAMAFSSRHEQARSKCQANLKPCSASALPWLTTCIPASQRCHQQKASPELTAALEGLV